MGLDETFEVQHRISSAVADTLAMEMEQYGLLILSAQVTALEPDSEVKDAMNNIIIQRFRQEVAVAQADTNRINVVTAAEGRADVAELQGKGSAMRASAIIHGLRETLTGSAGIQNISHDAFIEVYTLTNYFEALKQIADGPNSEAVFILNQRQTLLPPVAQDMDGTAKQTQGQIENAPRAPELPQQEPAKQQQPLQQSTKSSWRHM